MTGIERLRKLSEDMLSLSLWVRLTTRAEKDWDCYQGDGRTVNGELLSIADQIEHERNVDSEGLYEENEDLRDMLNQVAWHLGLGDEVHYYSGDNYAACQSRVLDAIEGLTERESDVETVRSDAMEAWEWVREHGGLDHVKAEWSSRVPHDLYERRRQRLLDHIAECETALGRRNVRIEELGKTIEFFQLNNSNFRHLLADVAERLGFTRYGDDYEPEDLLDSLDRRLMPEGCEWPRYESGEPVGFGDDVSRHGEDFEANVIALYRDGSFSLNFWAYSKGERVKRPAVPSADGEPLEVGQTVWDTNGDELVIGALEDGGHTVTCRYADVGDGIPVHGMWSPSDLTHQRPVLDAGGVPIKKGDTVYLLPGEWCDEFPCLGFHGGEELEVFTDEEPHHVSGGVQCREKEKKVGFRGYCYPQPSQLTHRAPVLAADGEPLEVGQTVWDADGMEFRVESFDSNGVWGAWKTDDGWIKAHPCPTLFTHQRPVLDADGNRIEPAMDVWWVCEGDERGTHAEKLHVESIGEDGLVACDPFNGGTSVVLDPAELYVKKPVLDADGVPIKVGDTVWDDHGEELVVLGLSGGLVRCRFSGETCIDSVDDDRWEPSQLTHEPPDSWERIEEDAGCTAAKYNERRGTIFTTKQQVARDLVRRCRALAGVSE